MQNENKYTIAEERAESFSTDMLQYTGVLVSLDSGLMDTIGVHDNYDFIDGDTDYDKNEKLNVVWDTLKTLYAVNHRRYLIMYMRFYLNISIRDIGDIFGVSHVMILKDLMFTLKKVKKTLGIKSEENDARVKKSNRNNKKAVRKNRQTGIQ